MTCEIEGCGRNSGGRMNHPACVTPGCPNAATLRRIDGRPICAPCRALFNRVVDGIPGALDRITQEAAGDRPAAGQHQQQGIAA